MSDHRGYQPVFELLSHLDAQAHQQLQELCLGYYSLGSDDLQGRLDVGQVLRLQLFPFLPDFCEMRQLVVSDQGLDDRLGDGPLDLVVLVPVHKLSHFVLHYVPRHQRRLRLC